MRWYHWAIVAFAMLVLWVLAPLVERTKEPPTRVRLEDL
jgi:hypothetical protein